MEPGMFQELNLMRDAKLRRKQFGTVVAKEFSEA
jgi:hypothetical protein